MSLETSLNTFQGDSIFRNQPPHTHFNKSFEDPTDAFFLALHEVHPFYFKPEQLQDNRAFDYHVLIDPRNKQPVTEVYYDHTPSAQRPRVFRSGIKSRLTKKQHLHCLAVLLAWQERKEVNETDLMVWRRLETKRQQEKLELQKFVLNYAQTNKENIYAPVKRLVENYKRWYAEKLRVLLEHQQNVAYNTHAGLPHLRLCKSEAERIGKIADVQLLARSGWVPLLSTRFGADLRNLHHHFETYANDYLHCIEEEEGFLQQTLEAQMQAVQEKMPVFSMPMEALLLLLTAGDYTDLPTEVFVEIREENDIKVLRFDEPLPARNCAWHTHKQMVEQAFAAYLRQRGDTKWLLVEQERLQLQADYTNIEIEAVPKQPLEYKPYTFDAYLQQNMQQHKCQTKPTGRALIKWTLEKTGAESGIQLLTTVPLAAAVDEVTPTLLASLSIKLEYKPQFGCEIMTKYELLKQWLQLTLLQIDAAKCLRVAAADLQLQLEQHLTLADVEHQLADIYHINMPQLLANLYEFLMLLTNMPTGKFLLRYNAKYRDKLMLCAPSTEITQNTTHLHALLKVEPSDLCFMTQLHHLPISDTLCSVMHCFHKIMPCAFLPQLGHQVKYKLQKAEEKMLNFDAQAAQKRLAAKMEQKKNELKKTMSKQAKKKKRQRQRKRKELQKRQVDAEEQKNKELERILFEF